MMDDYTEVLRRARSVLEERPRYSEDLLNAAMWWEFPDVDSAVIERAVRDALAAP